MFGGQTVNVILKAVCRQASHQKEPGVKGLIAFVAAFSIAVSGLAAERSSPWPRFRGPNGSGVAEGQKPPVEFGPEKNVRWKVAVPSGLSSPIVAGENLVLTAFEDGKLYTIAYRRADGKEAWRSEAPAKQIEAYHKVEGSPAASTPATDGERIVSYFGSYGLLCYDLSGRELWTFPMPLPQLPGSFGSGVSSIIAEGKVILVRDDAKDSKIITLDAATGKLVWERKRQSPVSYSTPVIWDTPTGKQVVAAGHGRMIGYDLQTGAERWSLHGMPSSCCASPVTADGLLYFAGWSPGGPEDKEFQMPSYDSQLKELDADKDGMLSRDEAGKRFTGFFDSLDTNVDGKIARDEYEVMLRFMAEGRNSAFALQPGASGEVTDSNVLWKQTKGLPYVSSAIMSGGQYVMVKDGGIVMAYDPTSGDEIFMSRMAAPGRYYASPVAANGYLYFTSLDDGSVTVLKAGSAQPEVAARNPALGERVAATPALADDTLYLRTESHLYAFGERQ